MSFNTTEQLIILAGFAKFILVALLIFAADNMFKNACTTLKYMTEAQYRAKSKKKK